MHSEWSDGSPTVADIVDACLARGYQYAAVTDHSYGLKIAGGMSMEEAAAQRKAIDQVNARHGSQFTLLQGIEANIDAAGRLDLTSEEAATFDVVLAAPHSRLRKDDDQTDRMLAAIEHPKVRILAHPRGRISGSRAGVVARWDAVFEVAAQRRVALELDGDPARQDLDHTLARQALRGGLSLCTRQRRAHNRTAVVRGDGARACAPGRHSRRQNRELLAPRAAAGVAVRFVVEIPVTPGRRRFCRFRWRNHGRITAFRARRCQASTMPSREADRSGHEQIEGRDVGGRRRGRGGDSHECAERDSPGTNGTRG